ncbi:MAG TPA: hypothetical protein VIM62_02310 [Acidobacteriaceae bacterium]
MSASTPANLTAPGLSISESSAPGFSSPQEEAMLTLFRTADALEHELQQRLKPYGITGPQYNVLRILRAAQSQTQESRGLMCSAIGRLMITPEPDITRLLARLKAHKLVTQRRDSRDGRVVLTSLSAAGAQLLAKLDSLIGETPAELMRGLSAAEIKELTRLLAKTRSCCAGKKEEAREPAVTGHQSSPHSPRWSLPRHHPE